MFSAGNGIFANHGLPLRELTLRLPKIDRQLMLMIAPSLHVSCCDNLLCLFKACPNVKDTTLEFGDIIAVDLALHYVHKLVEVAWRKTF